MTNTTKLTSPNGSIDPLIDPLDNSPSGHSSDEHLIDSFKRARGKRFYWSSSLTKSAIVGASSFGAIAAVGFALINDTAPPPEGFQEVSSAPAPDSVTPAPTSVPQRSVVPQPSVEFSARPIARLPGAQLPPLPVLTTARAAIMQPLPRLEHPSAQLLYSPTAAAIASQAAASRISAPPHTAPRPASPTAQLLPADPNPMPPRSVSAANLPQSATPQSATPPPATLQAATLQAATEASRSPIPRSATPQIATTPALSQPSEAGSPFQKQSELQSLADARLQIVRSIAFTTDNLPEMSPPQFSANPASANPASANPASTNSQTAVTAVQPGASPSLTREEQSAVAAQPEADIRYFLDRSQRSDQISLLPLTDRAATEVSTADNVAEFRVFHLPSASYAQVWSAVSQDPTQPEHGFIDYERQVIVVPVDRRG